VGDVVRVRYVCSLVEGNKVLFSTKGQMKRRFVEFALGFNQVIKGFDRALPKMSIGERSKLTFTPEYAYGKVGLFPIVPPDAEISFDLTLLGI
jgi:FK506-binding protein 1